MNKSFRNALTRQKESSKVLEIPGVLGITIDGERTVEVRNRNSFVYVQLRNNQNELIQAFNDKVSPVYGLPVIVVRDGNRYVIDRRDTQRYTDWQSYSSFLPRHGDQHSFNGMRGGGDVVWVYGRQFMPMLVIPSGTLGGPNVIVSEYVIQDQNGNWKYSGNTGTENLLQYKPTDNQGVMVLVYIDQNTGNPGVIVNSGSPFLGSLTGTSDIVPYLPQVTNPAYLVSMAVRLVSGTSSIGWDNLYDVRQYYNGFISTGTGGGISSIPIQDEGIPQGSATTFNFVGAGVTASISGSVVNVDIPSGGAGGSGVYKNPGSVLFAGADGYPDEDNLRFYWDNVNKAFRVGPPSPILNLAASKIQNVGTSGSATPSYALLAYGTGTSGSPHPTFIGYRQRGTLAVPEPIGDNDGLFLLVGSGFDGADFINTARLRFSAQGDYVTGTYTGSKAEIQVTPSGTNSRQTRLEVVGNGTNIPDGYYMISGVPHTHDNSSGDMLSILTSSEVSISGSIVLDSAAFGKMHKISGLSTNYAIILPSVSGNARKLIGFRVPNDSEADKLYTLSGTIDGLTSRSLWANETAILLCDGSAWYKVSGKSLPMLATMHKNGSQTGIVTSTITKITIDTIDADVGGMADTTNKRINIRRTGTYDIVAQVYWDTGAITRGLCIVYKNGTTFWSSETNSPATGHAVPQVLLSMDLVAGDYIELYCFHNKGSNFQTDASGITFLQLKENLLW